MSMVRFAPAASLNTVRMTALAVLTAGLFAFGMLSGTGTAGATGPTGVNSCLGINVVCVGQISGNPITVTVGNIEALNNNDVKLELENILNHSANILNIQVQVDKIATDLEVYLKDVLHVSICQIKVVELGWTNLNLANCH